MIEGARPSEMPGFIKPQLATLKSKAPIVGVGEELIELLLIRSM
jgi:hypothetical protein